MTGQAIVIVIETGEIVNLPRLKNYQRNSRRKTRPYYAKFVRNLTPILVATGVLACAMVAK